MTRIHLIAGRDHYDIHVMAVGVQEAFGQSSWVLLGWLSCVESGVRLNDPHGSFPWFYDSYKTLTSVLILECGIKMHEQFHILFYNQMPNFEFSYKIAWLLRVERYGDIHLRITGDHWHSFYLATTDFASHWRTKNFFLNVLVFIFLTQVFSQFNVVDVCL